MPNPEEEEKALGRQRRRRQQPVAASLSLLIEAHPLVLQHLASSPDLLLVTCKCARLLLYVHLVHIILLWKLNCFHHRAVSWAQVRNVLQLYVDVEHTGRNAEFIEKFEQRERMGELLSAHSMSSCLCAECLAVMGALLS